MRNNLLIALFAVLLVGCGSGTNKTNNDSGPPPGDGQADGAGGDGTTGGNTIYEIMDGTIREGAKVLLNDVIVTAVDGNAPYTGDVYVQDPEGGMYSAIMIFMPERADGGEISDLRPGDRVKVEGTVKYHIPEYSDTGEPLFPNNKHIKELDQAEITRLGPGTPPEPEVLTPQALLDQPIAEGWENVLAQVKNVKVTKEADPEYGDFEVTGGLEIAADLFPASPTVGDCLTITGIVKFFFDNRINPRSAEDLQTASCPVAATVSIKDIQDESSPDHPEVGAEVAVEGVVTAVDSLKSSAGNYKGFWIQDPAGGPFSGIYVYHFWQDSTSQKPVLGEAVELTGTYDEYPLNDPAGSVSELKNVTWTSKGPAPAQPEPAVVNAADVATGGSQTDQYEGVLITVNNITVNEIRTDSNENKVAFTDNASGLVVDHDLYEFFDGDTPAVGTVYSSITGVLHLDFDKYRLLPRSAADMVEQ